MQDRHAITLTVNDDIFEMIQSMARTQGLSIEEQAEDLIEMMLFEPDWEKYPGAKEI